MVNKTQYFILIILVFSVFFIFPQSKEQIKNQKNELAKIKSDISALEAQLKIKTTKEKQSNATLENYNKQNFLLNRLINKLRDEEQLKQNDIDFTLQQIDYIEKEIKILQVNYSKYIVSVYKKGKDDEIEALLNSASVQQALIRYKYLQKFAEKRERDLNEYQKNKSDLVELKDRYEKERKEKLVLAEQKETEANDLQKKLVERKKVLNAIRRDKTELKKSITLKRSAESKIRNLIAKLIEEEETKRKAERERLAKLETSKLRKESRHKAPIEKKHIENESNYDVDISTAEFSSFSMLKGKLNWPVSGGKIIRHFGEDKNTKLNTVSLNYGVDIKASSDLNIKAPAEGIVSAIDWIPGYGGVIIITHKGGYRTVYSHFSDLFVKEGERVKAGSVLAKVGESIEGYIVHFEIWNSRNNQNPEIWLVKR